jgi:AcrR family transcriptional regulator
MTSSVPAGLRERKKAKTRTAIREAAMRLFEEQGWAATTVEQIAEAAEVSPSTFFRYFPTKEDVVLTDDYDPALIAALHAQPAGIHPVDAVIAALHEVFDGMSPEAVEAEARRQRLYYAVPDLRARALQQTADAVTMLGEALARREGLPPDDFSARVMAGAIVGAMLAVMPVGGSAGYQPADMERALEALILLRNGLPLG